MQATTINHECGNGQLLKELLGVMLRHYWLLAFAVLPNLLKPAIDPIQAYIAREVLNEIVKGPRTFALGELTPYIPWAIGIFLGLGILNFWEKISNRMLDDRLLISLQRIWFERRHIAEPGEQAARAINDCESARRPLDLFQKELWMAIIGLPAVLIWQLTLDPTLLPALLVAMTPGFLVALMFGGLIANASIESLMAVVGVGKAVGAGAREAMYRRQEQFYKTRVRAEMWKQFSEFSAEFSGLIGVVLVLLISYGGIYQLLPKELSAGQIGMFLINVKLVSKPLTEATKVYNKLRESWPV